MSLKQAAFIVHSLVQNICPCNYFVNIETDSLQPHPLYNQRHHHLLRFFTSTVAAVALPITFFYLIWLFIHQNSYVVSDYVFQLLVYVIAFLGLLILNYCNYVMATKYEERLYLINQACTTIKLDGVPTNFIMLGKYTLNELFVYIFSTIFLVVIIAVFVFPFTVSFDPVQLVFGDGYPVKALSSLIYGSTGAVLILYLLSFFLIYISALEIAELYSRKITLKNTDILLHANTYLNNYYRVNKNVGEIRFNYLFGAPRGLNNWCNCCTVCNSFSR